MSEEERELSFEELEDKFASSYSEVFDESSFMDEGELEVLITKEEKEAKARWADLHALQAEYPDARDFLTDVLIALIGARPTPVQYDIMDFLQRGILANSQFTGEQHIARIQTSVHEHRRDSRLLLTIDDTPLHRCRSAIARQQ